MEPLRSRPDYGEKGHRPQDYSDADLLDLARKLAREAANLVNPYLNTPPTKLKRDLESESDPKKKRQMQQALGAWRTTTPGPFWKTQTAKRLVKIAKCLLGI